MGQFVSKPLDYVGRQLKGVLDDVVMGRSNGALSHVLRHQKEIVPVKLNNNVKQKKNHLFLYKIKAVVLYREKQLSSFNGKLI